MTDQVGTSFDQQCLPLLRDERISYETFLKVTSMTPNEAREFLTKHELSERIETPALLDDHQEASHA